MCPSCADFNFFKRSELADLTGRTALITGARVKIGYQAALKLLRCGADVIVTTRFPRDSAQRYAAEPDFEQWRDRLEIFGLDLRHTPSVEAFCQHLLQRYVEPGKIAGALKLRRFPPAMVEEVLGEVSSPEDDLAAADGALRKKFRAVDPEFAEIETLYGVGYRYRERAKRAG